MQAGFIFRKVVAACLTIVAIVCVNFVIFRIAPGDPVRMMFRDPRVSAEVLNYRPFYIIGEIEKGGEYPFVNGMSVLNAVALAGGYTYRGNTNKAFITRRGHELEFPALPETRVYPGDVIRVPERFF